MTHHDIGAQHRLHHLGMQRAGDGRRHARTDRHGQECGVDAVAVGQTETHIGRPASRIDLEFVAESLHDVHDLLAGGIYRPDRHHQRIDHHVAGRNAVIGGTLDDFLRHFKPHVDVGRNAGVVVADGNHGRAVLLHEW